MPFFIMYLKNYVLQHNKNKTLLIFYTDVKYMEKF
jgi:hypothetical protein